MKWIIRLSLFSLLLFAAVIGGLYYASNGANGSVVHEASVEIDRPAFEVYPWLLEKDKLMQWISGLKDITPETDMGLIVGAKGREVMEINGTRFELFTEITNLIPNKLLTIKLTSDDFKGDVCYILFENDGKTELFYYGGFQYIPFYARLFEPLITPSAKKQLERELVKLKQLVEKS